MPMSKIEEWDNKKFGMFFGAYLVAMGIFIAIGASGPPNVISTTNYAYNCKANGVPAHEKVMCLGGVNLKDNSSVFSMTTPEISALNTFFVYSVTPYSHESGFFTIHKYLNLKVVLSAKLTPDAKEFTQLGKPLLIEEKLTCTEAVSRCNTLNVLFEEFINYSEYKVDLQMLNVGGNSTSWLGDVEGKFTYGNAAYSNLQLGFRITFLIINAALFVVFMMRMKREGTPKQWGFDQKALCCILVATILMNNPFFPFAYVIRGWFMNLITAWSEVIYASTILFFWLVILDKLRRDELRVEFEHFYRRKIVVVGLYTLFMLIGTASVIIEYSISPSLSFLNPATVEAIVFFTLALLVYLCIMLWFVYLVFQCLIVIKMKPSLKNRFIYIGGPSVVLALSGIVTALVRIATGAAGNKTESLQFVVTFWLQNTFTWVLAYGFWPEEKYANNKFVAQLDDDDEIEQDEDNDETQPITSSA